MAEITRVPLQPIRKGSLTKLWLGVAAALLLAGAFAWAAIPQGVTVTEHTAGAGGHPTLEDVVIVNYVGKLADGKVFDQGEAVPLPLQGMIPGFTEGLLQMRKGGKYTLVIPADKAYGAEEKVDQSTGQVVIPANSDLTFDVELLEFMSEADFQRQMQMMQMMQQQMQQQQGGQGAPPPQ